MKRLLPIMTLCVCCAAAFAGCKEKEKGGPDNSLSAKVAGMYEITYSINNSPYYDATLMVTKGSDISAILDMFRVPTTQRTDMMPTEYNLYVRSGVAVSGEEGAVKFGSLDPQQFSHPATFINGETLDKPWISTTGEFNYMYADQPASSTPHWVKYTTIVQPQSVSDDESVTIYDPIIINAFDKRYDGDVSAIASLVGSYDGSAMVTVGDGEPRVEDCTFLVTRYDDNSVNVALKLASEEAAAPHNIYLLRLPLTGDITAAVTKRRDFTGKSSNHIQFGGVPYNKKGESYSGSFLPKAEGVYDVTLIANFQIETSKGVWTRYSINASTEVDV